jgi:hypothetical protein
MLARTTEARAMAGVLKDDRLEALIAGLHAQSQAQETATSAYFRRRVEAELKSVLPRLGPLPELLVTELGDVDHRRHEAPVDHRELQRVLQLGGGRVTLVGFERERGRHDLAHRLGHRVRERRRRAT